MCLPRLSHSGMSVSTTREKLFFSTMTRNWWSCINNSRFVNKKNLGECMFRKRKIICEKSSRKWRVRLRKRETERKWVREKLSFHLLIAFLQHKQNTSAYFFFSLSLFRLWFFRQLRVNVNVFTDNIPNPDDWKSFLFLNDKENLSSIVCFACGNSNWCLLGFSGFLGIIHHFFCLFSKMQQFLSLPFQCK